MYHFLNFFRIFISSCKMNRTTLKYSYIFSSYTIFQFQRNGVLRICELLFPCHALRHLSFLESCSMISVKKFMLIWTNAISAVTLLSDYQTLLIIWQGKQTSERIRNTVKSHYFYRQACISI